MHQTEYNFGSHTLRVNILSYLPPQQKFIKEQMIRLTTGIINFFFYSSIIFLGGIEILKYKYIVAHSFLLLKVNFKTQQSSKRKF